MSAAIREPVRVVITQVAAEMACDLVNSVRSEGKVTIVNLGGYTEVRLWDDRGLKFSVALDDQNWDRDHEPVHLDHARAAVRQAIGTVAERLLGVAEIDAKGQALSLGHLSARERELVTLIAQGRADAQIAGQLCISVSTVRSHLDRIRDKTGCRRRADLIRLAQTAGLV